MHMSVFILIWSEKIWWRCHMKFCIIASPPPYSNPWLPLPSPPHDLDHLNSNCIPSVLEMGQQTFISNNSTPPSTIYTIYRRFGRYWLILSLSLTLSFFLSLYLSILLFFSLSLSLFHESFSFLFPYDLFLSLYLPIFSKIYLIIYQPKIAILPVY